MRSENGNLSPKISEKLRFVAKSFKSCKKLQILQKLQKVANLPKSCKTDANLPKSCVFASLQQKHGLDYGTVFLPVSMQ